MDFIIIDHESDILMIRICQIVKLKGMRIENKNHKYKRVILLVWPVFYTKACLIVKEKYTCKEIKFKVQNYNTKHLIISNI